MFFNKCLRIDIFFYVLIVNNIFFWKNKKKFNKGYYWSFKFCNYLFLIIVVVLNIIIS